MSHPQDLPFDIITNILTRLPPKSLLRFKSVSKPWYSTITNPDFIKSHLSLTNSPKIILRGSFLYSLNHSNPSPKPTPLDYPYKTTDGGVEILGSCNGLILISVSVNDANVSEVFCVWNPSTKEFKKMVTTPIEFLGNAFCTRSVLYGFGYDCIIDDYKVVRIVNYHADGDEIDSEVKVYRLGTNSWKMVKGVPFYLLYKRVWGVLVNGKLHWAATRLPESDMCNVIAAFDVVDEVFKEVPMPECRCEDDSFYMNVDVLGGCLCMLCNYETRVCDLWVMKIYGEQESWSKVFSVEQGSVFGRFDYLKPLCYSEDGGILMEKNGNKIVLYNPKRKKVKTINTSVGATDWCESDTYVESLVSLNSGTYVGKEHANVRRKENNKKDEKKRGSVTEEKKSEERREVQKMQATAPVISLKNPHRVMVVDSVLTVVNFDGFSHSIRLNAESTIDGLRNYVCRVFTDLRETLFRIVLVNGNSSIETTHDLQAAVCYCFVKKLTYMVLEVIKVNELRAMSASGDGGSSTSISGITSSASSSEVQGFVACPVSDFLTHVGQKFRGGVSDFRIQLMKHCMLNGYKFKLLKNEPKRITAVCKLKGSTGCPWRVHATPTYPNSREFCLKEFDPSHTCGSAFVDMEKYAVSSKLVKTVIVDMARDNSGMKPQEVIDFFSRNFRVSLSYYVAYSALHTAMNEVHGDDELSYHQLDWYLKHLEIANPGSRIILEKDNVTRQFRRVFIALGPCIRGFNHCRPLLALDGTFLKNKYKGCLLAATGVNGDSGIFPLAFAIVCSENKDNWIWFMEQLKHVVADDRNLTFMSDRHPGLLACVPSCFPESWHSYCMFHLKLNLSAALSSMKKSRSDILNAFEELCYAPTPTLFHQSLDYLKSIGGVKVEAFLNNLLPENYANAFFEGFRYGYMCSNFAESFNNWILKERHLPLTAMIDKIRLKFMKMMAERRDACQSWVTRLCPKQEAELSKRMLVGATWPVIKCSEFKYEVHNISVRVVDISAGVCSCNAWRIDGFPCAHGLRAIQFARQNVYSFVDECFYTSTFRKTYAEAIEPVPTAEMPSVLPSEPSTFPPIGNRAAGRPCKKRKPNVGSDVKRVIECGRCKTKGHHNRLTCNAVL